MASAIPERRQGVPAAGLTDGELRRLAREHVTYAVVTLVHALDEVVRLRASGQHRSHTYNVNVEAAVVLARALHDFLRGEGKKSDDLQAAHYLPGWTIPDILSRDLRDTINKQGPHITTARLDKQSFDLPGITADILRGMLQFVGQLEPGRREWFAEAERVAGIMLTVLPGASSTPRYRPAKASSPQNNNPRHSGR